MNLETLKTVVTTGRTIEPPRILLYAVEGIGKSTFGANAYNPIFIQTEDGLNELPVSKFPQVESFETLMDYLRLLMTETHEYKTLVIDTIDWLEPIVWAYTCAVHGEPNIEGQEKKSKFGYAKGYHFAVDTWEKLITALDDLRLKKGMAILLIGHSEIKRFDSPETESYDRYQPKLQRLATALLCEWCDAVLFANYVVRTEETDVGFKKTVVRGKGGIDRSLYTQERPAFRAKNRYSLPPELPFVKGQAWNILMTEIKNNRVEQEEPNAGAKLHSQS